MKIIEYGKANEEVLLLLHGGGLSAWNYRDAANQLKENYHVIVPQLLSLIQPLAILPSSLT